jgi:uncharacterized membrane protein YphA (DoxX/SURF4 family)
MKSILNKSILHASLSVLLALFFIYAGSQKFIPSKNKKRDNTELVNSVKTGTYEAPYGFYVVVGALKTSGFLKVVGVLQILSGLFILYPKTRMLGLILLLPVVLNIFLLHLFLHEVMEENIETGAFLVLNITLLFFYKKRFTALFKKMKSSISNHYCPIQHFEKRDIL